MGFFYSFIQTCLHSIWQAAILILLFSFLNFAEKNINPLQKRNRLYCIIGFQFCMSFVTFLIYFLPLNIIPIGFFSFKFISKNIANDWLNSHANLFFYVYVIWVIFKSTTVCYQYFQLKTNYYTRLIKPSAAIKIFAELKSYELNIKRKVTIWYSKKIEVPITFGFFKPLILLPFSLVNAISLEETEAIIIHELAHIKNRDYLLNWLLVAVEIIYFFNPFIKIITNKIKLEREKVCDIHVLDFKYNEITYAATLLKIAKRSIAVNKLQITAAGSTKQLLSRILFFTDPKNRELKKSSNFLFILIVPFLLVGSYTFFSLFKYQNKEIKNVQTVALTATQIAQYFSSEKRIILTESINFNTPEKKYKGEKIINNRKVLLPKVFIESTFSENTGNYNLQAAYDARTDSVKEIIYNVETQQGKISQSYRLTFLNGNWQIQPMWMLVETKNDSLHKINIDSMLNNNTVQ